MTYEENIKAHDKAMELWTETGEVLHIWRDYNNGYLVSKYVTMFKRNGFISVDCARIFGKNPISPSIDQRVDTYMEDNLEDIRFSHKRVNINDDN